MISKYMAEKWGRKKQNGSRALERGRSENARMLRNRLMCMACMPSGTRVMSGPGLLLRTVSGSIALQ